MELLLLIAEEKKKEKKAVDTLILSSIKLVMVLLIVVCLSSCFMSRLGLVVEKRKLKSLRKTLFGHQTSLL